MTTLKPDEVMYALYCRHLNSQEWWEQETTRNLDDAKYWLDRNQKRESNREYVLVKKVTRFEMPLNPQEKVTEVPCVHEWYQGMCVHCEITVKEFRAAGVDLKPYEWSGAGSASDEALRAPKEDVQNG